MGIRWQDCITPSHVLLEAGVDSIETVLTTQQRRWVGHLSRIGDDRKPNAIFFGELKVGRRNRGAPVSALKINCGDMAPSLA